MSQNRFSTTVGQFQADVRGNVAIIFSLAAIPLMFMTGAAIDYGRALTVRAKLQSAVDSTVLALIREPKGTPVAKLQARAEAYLAAMHDKIFTGATNIHVSVAGQNVQVSAEAIMPTAFMKLVRKDTMTLSTTATGTFGRSKVQVALVLDNTGSMGQLGKMPALKSAATDLVNKLEAMASSPGEVKV